MNFYKALNNQKFVFGPYSIVPIRFEDRIEIMNWRNEQIYHLRQSKPLTEADQNHYFQNVVAILFEQKEPGQVLFSYLENDTCIGYGGLVHINWTDQNAEISFIMDTTLEKEHFHFHWQTYLELLEKVAFEELGLHKIYTYAFDLRPHLYVALESSGFQKEGVLKEHCIFEGQFKDVVIHSKINQQIKIRSLRPSDRDVLLEWSNDPLTRENSFHQVVISKNNHQEWFKTKMDAINLPYYIFETNNTPMGIVRFDVKEGYCTVGININPDFRKKGLAVKFLRLGCEEYLKKNKLTINAYIKPTNIASIKTFEKAGFKFFKNTKVNGQEALQYQLKND